MFGFGRKKSGETVVERLHGAVVAASRQPDLYGEGALPDTIEGRFESLVLHLVLTLRRLRGLPPPADDVAQDLVDMAFTYLEVALRETGIGDFGVPKRMKKLAQAFYDRTPHYDAALDARDGDALAAELGRRLAVPADRLASTAAYMLAGEAALARLDLDGLLSGLDLPRPAAVATEGVR